jgi:L-malate glycosyltransferase
MKILHIAPHLGGGVGRFCSNVYGADQFNHHVFLLLEQPIDIHLLQNIHYSFIKDIQVDFQLYIAAFDIVQIEFWNHPLLLKFLIENDLENCRLLLYSHVSGMYAPNLIPKQVFDFCDLVILSTPGSSTRYSKQLSEGKCRIIHGVAGTNKFQNLLLEKHNEFNIAYIGTASFTKLHSFYLESCKKIIRDVPNVHFFFVSNDSNIHLQEATINDGIERYFSFLTKLQDVEKILSQADLFGYPLRADHFGTGEQSLIEAMSAGVPPVVLSNPAEMSLVQDGITGFVATDMVDYVKIIKFCSENKDYLHQVGTQAQLVATNEFMADITLSSIKQIYIELLVTSKSNHSFSSLMPNSDPHSIGFEIFKLFIDEDSIITNFIESANKMQSSYFKYRIQQSALIGKNKGGIYMYLDVFPEDRILRQIADEIIV